MLFGKKKGMIDVRELARQGKITPMGGRTIEGEANRDGFVELGSSVNPTKDLSASVNTMNFFDTPPVPSTSIDNSNIVERITALSKKISKMDQRLEVIERKLGVGDSAPPVMW